MTVYNVSVNVMRGQDISVKCMADYNVGLQIRFDSCDFRFTGLDPELFLASAICRHMPATFMESMKIAQSSLRSSSGLS